MDCERVREFCDLFLVGELREVEREGIEVHLTCCAACSEQIALDRSIRESLQRSGRGAAPDALRARIAAALDAPAVARAPRRRRLAAAAALVLALLGGLLWHRQRAHPGWPPSRDMAATHVHYRNQQEPPYQVVTPDARALARWIGDKLGSPVELPERGWTILGARISSVNRREAGLVFYQDRGMRISLFVVPAKTLRLDGMKQVEIRGRTCWYRFHDGYRVLIWREGAVWYGAVSDGRNIVWR